MVDYFKEHPSMVAGLFRELRWIDFKDGQEYSFELISYYQAQSYKYKDGGYICFAAMCLSDSLLPVIEKDTILKIHFSYKTFVNALLVLPASVRIATLRDRLGDNNMFIRFIRHKKTRMEILEFEPRQNTPELSKKATDLVYENVIFKSY